MLSSSVTIIVTVRDRVSTTERTLRALIDTTDDHPIVVILGGCDRRFVDRLRRAVPSPRISIEVVDRLLNPAESRNIGLRLATTPLVAIVDTDVVPRAGWLDALVDCQRTSGAAAVVPLILERPTSIHCAGTDLYIDWAHGVALAHKELRYHRKPFHDRSNLRRCEIDYAELHCQLVDRMAHLELGAFDEQISEGGEIDQALVLREAEHQVWFEPASVVLFDRFAPVSAVDIPHYAYKWDAMAMLDSLDVVLGKWGIDPSEEGHFLVFLSDTNALVGKLARRFPHELVLRVTGRLSAATTMLLRLPTGTYIRRRRARWGRREWDARLDRVKAQGPVPLHPVVAGLRDRPANYRLTDSLLGPQ